MRPLRSLPFHAVASALLFSTALLCNSVLPAQNSAVAPRITANVDETSLTTLKGNVPLRARAQFDQGEAPGSTQLDHVRLVLERSSEQQAALDKYLGELQDKSSPNYHKWLTPAEFGKLYGPADSDVAALVAWLESHGLKLETVSLGRTNIAFSGTVSQLEEAFHTTIHSYTANGSQFFSNTADPKIPAALVPVVKGVAQLNTIRPRPLSVRGSTGRFNPDTKRLEPAEGLSPNLTLGSGTVSDPYFLYIVPGDAATIYDTPNSYNANFAGGTSYTGAGVYIGIGGDAAINASIVESYRIMFIGDSSQPGLNYCTSSSVSSCTNSAGSGYNASDADEAYIDTELAGGMAPGAIIIYYASPNLNTAIDAAITQNQVDIFSLSFGDCEEDMGTSGNDLIDGYWGQAAAQGIAVTVSTGDSGSAGCDNDNSQTVASGGLQVSGFASTPYNIAVGGTDFYALANSFSSYASTSQGSPSTHYRTALKYIPESTWNDSSKTDDFISTNVPVTGTYQGQNLANIVAGSGGASAVYSKPSWQTGEGVPADGKRDLPDVSLMAGNGYDPATWLVCTADPAGTGEANCQTQSNNEFYFVGYGGTSTSAPSFAGILALVEQKTGGRLGQAAAELQQLYNLANGSHASSIFHDVTVGNNSVPCTEGSANCVLNTAGYYFESGYNTTTGYDLATGIGSVDATQLVNYWGSTSGTMAATVTLTPTPSPVNTVESLSVPVTVTGSSGTPTGTVTLSGGGYTSGAQELNSLGDSTFTVPAGDLAIGDDTLTVTYSGDSTYAATNMTASVLVNGLTASVTATPSSASINSNQSVTVTGTVSGSGGTPTGTVTLTGGGYTSAATALSSGGYSITIPANSLSAGSDLLTVTYGGNSTYDAGAFGTTTVMVTHVVVLTPTVTVTPALTSIGSNQSLNVTVTVAGSGAMPTGTVTLASGGYSSGAQTLGAGGCTAASCAITIPANSLNSSLGGKSDTLTATYSGDSNYFSGSGTANVTVTSSVFSVSATTPTGVTPGGSTSSTITASSSLFYSGTVTISCELTSEPIGANDPPSCTFPNGSTITLSAGVPTPGSVTASANTTAASSELVYPKVHGGGWVGAGGGALLALLVFLGIPARRRSWRQMLGVLVVMAALGSLAGCGSPSAPVINNSNPGTTAGNYAFTVTGTGNPAVMPAPSTRSW